MRRGARWTAAAALALAVVACGARSELLDGPSATTGGAAPPAGSDDGGESVPFDAGPGGGGAVDAAHGSDAGDVTGDAGPPGGDACSGDCEPAVIPAPRPIAPLSTTTATSQRPLLKWALASGTDGALVEICRDRACTNRVETFSASGTSGAPSTALAKGLYYWRVRGTANGFIGKPVSPVWQLYIGGRSAPVSTSWGTTLDVNGDGYPDVVVGADENDDDVGVAYLYMGTPTGPSTTPVTIASPEGTDGLFGTSVASAGDVNGDGYADVVIGGRGILTQPGYLGGAYVYLGGPAGLSATPAPLGGPATENGAFGCSVASAGDVNGDGYADVVVGAYGESAAYLYLGGPAGITTTATTLGPGPKQFGISVASAGDLNGDGFADVVVGANEGYGSSGSVYVYFGGAAGLSTSPLVIDGPGAAGEFGYSAACAGDVNADGFEDLVVGAVAGNPAGGTTFGGGVAYVYLGGPGGPLSGPTLLDGASDPVFFFGESVSSAGDVNGDGFDDVVVASGGNDVEGSAFLYLGGPLGVSTQVASFVPAGGSLYTAVAPAGDVNGDGFADVLVGMPFDGANLGGSVALFVGGSGGLLTLPSTTLGNPASGGGYFGGGVY